MMSCSLSKRLSESFGLVSVATIAGWAAFTRVFLSCPYAAVLVEGDLGLGGKCCDDSLKW